MGSDTVSSHHFGGGFVPKRGPGDKGDGDDLGRPRTHKEVMEEVIGKAKMYKDQRQAEKRENEAAMSKLDTQFQDILGLVYGDDRKAEASGRIYKPPKNDEFDIAVRELAFEVKARPTDRMKTPAEVAAAEHLRLKSLEEER